VVLPYAGDTDAADQSSHELKCATATTKTKVAKVRAEPKTFGTADQKCMLCYDVSAAEVTNSVLY